jgi:hypothetical protein
MALNKGLVQLTGGVSQVSNIGGTSGDNRSAPLSWIDWWSQETGNNEACLGECPLEHAVGAINVCCSVGGHVYLRGDNSYWYDIYHFGVNNVNMHIHTS